MRFRYKTLVSASLTIGLLNHPRPAEAAPFTLQGQDLTPSLGQFQIVPNPLYQPALAGVAYPGYRIDKKRLRSPVLFDPTTRIDRSSSVDVGSAAYNNGAEVGAIGSGNIVSNNSITLFPSTYVPPAAGTHVVFTQIKSFTLSGGGGLAQWLGLGCQVRRLRQ